jgi:hypothetical protein
MTEDDSPARRRAESRKNIRKGRPPLPDGPRGATVPGMKSHVTCYVTCHLTCHVTCHVAFHVMWHVTWHVTCHAIASFITEGTIMDRRQPSMLSSTVLETKAVPFVNVVWLDWGVGEAPSSMQSVLMPPSLGAIGVQGLVPMMTFIEHSENIRGTLRAHLGKIRENSEN